MLRSDQKVLDSYRDAMATLNSWVPEPADGLPEEFFLWISRFTPLVNVDLIIKDHAGQTLLTWRDDDTYGAGWHIPGGIIRLNETAEARVQATARNELGTEVEFEVAPIAVEQAIASGRIERGHFVSLVYRCRLKGVPDQSLRYLQGAPCRGQWAWHATCPHDLLPAQAAYRRFF